MTPRERAAAALELKIPDQVPTFELEFQLEDKMFGRKFIPDELKRENIAKLSEAEKEKKIYETAEFFAHVYTELEYSIIPGYGPGITKEFWQTGVVTPEMKLFFKYLRQMVGDKMMIGFHGDGTYAIPDGNKMYEFAYALADDPDGMKEKAEGMANLAIKRNKALHEAGVEVLLLCSDYCYNSGPFVSPAMFAEFIQPYLYKIIAAARADGQYTIKHTDGNIMLILDQIVDCHPHALHSIDPMAGVDIKEVKRRVGDRVCLCGNVNCAALQTGTDADVIKSAEYCLTHAKPGGGYIFCTSNIPFRGMDPARYTMILDVWKRMRNY
jgi:uroporphyrinogen decarboxylase